jgi:hypothetical protein
MMTTICVFSVHTGFGSPLAAIESRGLIPLGYLLSVPLQHVQVSATQALQICA